MELLNRLPSLEGLTKQEILDTLLREEYGRIPARPYEVVAEQVSLDRSFCAGKADLQKLMLHCKAEWGTFSFPVYYVCPKRASGPVPAFVHINFRDLIPDRYQPTEEIIDEGFATLTFCYLDVTSDNDDFTNGLAGVVYPNGERGDTDCGKLGLWAWAASAVMDYAQTLPELDHARISVAGHSRLGKTALLAGAIDERFFCAFSNDSGCGGAALSRENTGEKIENIMNKFHFWFSKHFAKYVCNEDALPFDQHFLIAANLPHLVYVASAEEDLWACPPNEYMSCIAASEYYQKNGKVGFVHPNRLPECGEFFHEGDIAYHIRSGRHYFSREDWLFYLKYLRRHF